MEETLDRTTAAPERSGRRSGGDPKGSPAVQLSFQRHGQAVAFVRESLAVHDANSIRERITKGDGMSSSRKLKGLLALATDAVAQGSRAVEKVHRATTDRPFGVLTQLPAPIAVPARGVKLVHDVSLTAVYGSIRIVNQAGAAMVDAGFDLAESITEKPGEGASADSETRAP